MNLCILSDSPTKIWLWPQANTMAAKRDLTLIQQKEGGKRPKTGTRSWANYLKPTNLWNWRLQGDFIKEVIKRGNNVYIGTSFQAGKRVLKREIKQLVKAGYKPVSQGSSLLVKGVQ